MSPVSPLAERLGAAPSTRYEQVGDAWVPWTCESLEQDYKLLHEEAGVLDLSGAGLIGVAGPDAGAFLDESFTRDVMYMTPERTAMGLVLDDEGRPLDVVTLYRTEDEFLVETSVGSGTKVLDALRERAGDRVLVTDLRDERVVVGIEGPRSVRVLGDLLVEPVEGLPFQGARVTPFGSEHVLVSRTGVTGEFGFKFVVTWDQVAEVWGALAAVARPCGHEALETAMLEVRQPLVRREVLEDDTVLSAGLNWLVDMEKPGFVGKQALADLFNRGLPTQRVSIVSGEEAAPRTPVWLDGEAIGQVVFVRYSPGLGAYCGVANLATSVAASGLELRVGESPGDGASGRTVSAPARTPTSWEALRG